MDLSRIASGAPPCFARRAELRWGVSGEKFLLACVVISLERDDAWWWPEMARFADAATPQIREFPDPLAHHPTNSDAIDQKYSRMKPTDGDVIEGHRKISNSLKSCRPTEVSIDHDHGVCERPILLPHRAE